MKIYFVIILFAVLISTVIHGTKIVNKHYHENFIHISSPNDTFRQFPNILSTIKCFFCKKVINLTREFIIKLSTLQTIHFIIQEMCSVVEDYTLVCYDVASQIVDSYLIIFNRTEAVDTCMLDFSYKDIACNLMGLVQEKSLQVMKEEQFTRNVVEYILLMICENINDFSEKHQCKRVLTSETQMFLQNLIEFIEANRLNAKLSWCQPTSGAFQMNNSTFLCSTCETVVSFLKTLSKSEEIKPILHGALTKLCSLTGTFQTQVKIICITL
ncbi:unnamed protein product [Schistosoma turkestanicum]|nr:unnamed protein product [Schistosoma turkestanicum]